MTPAAQLDTLDLLREYDALRRAPQTLGVRERLVAVDDEIRHRAWHPNRTEVPA